MTTLRNLALAALATTFLLPAQTAPGAADAAAKPAVDAAAKPAAGPLVGVVNFVKAFDAYPRYIQMKGELEALQKTYDDRLRAMSNQINELRGTLQVVREDADDRPEKELALQRAIEDQRALAKIMRDRLELEEMRMMITVYQDFEEAIRRVAKARGVPLVLRVHDMGDPVKDPSKLSPKSVQGRIAGFERRMVWFASEQVDLTDDVIRLLMVPLDAGKAQDEPKAAEKPAAAPAEKAGVPEKKEE